MTAKTAVIIGGGVAGLAAGFELSRAGWRVQLIEASDEVGGRVRTVRRDGYTLDVGATQMSTGYEEYLSLCTAIGLRDEMIESSSHIGILVNGRIHIIDASNMRSAIFTGALSWRSKFLLLKTIRDFKAIRPPVNVADVSLSHVADTESAAAYALRRLNPEILEVLIDPVIRLYVMNAADSVSALEWFSTLQNLAGATMLSLNGGNDRMPKALAEHMDVRLNARAVSVKKIPNAVEFAYRTADGELVSGTADCCVIATRVPEAIAVYPEIQDVLGSFGDTLTYNRAWVVHLGYRCKPDGKMVGTMISRADEPSIGLLWCEHNKNPDRAPAGHALFSVYSDEAMNDASLALGDDGLAKLASAFVERLFPELRGQQDLVHVTHWPLAIPHPAPGIYKELAAMKLRLDASDRVQLAGDYLTCTGQNSAIHYGRQAARNIIAHHSTTTTFQESKAFS